MRIYIVNDILILERYVAIIDCTIGFIFVYVESSRIIVYIRMYSHSINVSRIQTKSAEYEPFICSSFSFFKE